MHRSTGTNQTQGFLRTYPLIHLSLSLSLSLSLPATCSTYQSQIYSTFDHLQFTFQGKCRYVYARDCRDPDRPMWTVYQITDHCWKNQHSPRRPFICTVGVEVHLELERREVLLFFSNGTALVNGQSIRNHPNFPFVYQSGGLNVSGSATKVVVAYTDDKTKEELPSLRVVFYPQGNTLDVTLAFGYYGKTCGLCGNWNQNRTDDRHRPGEVNKVEAALDFVARWRADECPREIFNIPCSFDLAFHQKAELTCSVLGRPHGAFASCRPVLTNQWQALRMACKQRACQCLLSGNKGIEECLCNALQGAADSCLREGQPPRQCSEYEAVGILLDNSA